MEQEGQQQYYRTDGRYNSVLSDRAVVGEGCYLEDSFVHSRAVVGNGVILSYLDIHDEVIPDHVVLHGLKQKNGKFVCQDLRSKGQSQGICAVWHGSGKKSRGTWNQRG